MTDVERCQQSLLMVMAFSMREVNYTSLTTGAIVSNAKAGDYDVTVVCERRMSFKKKNA